MEQARVPLILDVDTGIDDALAIALAVSSPRAEVLAITTVAGNVAVEQATANTLAVLDFLGETSIPVHRGASQPLVRDLHDARHFHGSDGLGESNLVCGERPLGRDRGPAAIIRLAHDWPGQLTLVCLGPLTNLAIALNVEPELPRLVRRVVAMAGAFNVGGNVTAHAEFNVYVDPEAAAQVFANRALDLTVLGLDVTQATALPKPVWERAAESAALPAQLVARLCPWMHRRHGKTGMFLHDPMAVAAALDPSLVSYTERSVTVSCAPEHRGETRAERTGRVKVAERVDTDRFMASFCETLGLQWVDVDLAAVEAI